MRLILTGRLVRTYSLAYSAPMGTLAALLPKGLTAEGGDGLGVVNVVVSQVSRLRPGGLPPVTGFDLWFVAYRLLVSAELATGERLRGLYFLASQVNRGALSPFINALTDLNAQPARFEIQDRDQVFRLLVKEPGRDSEVAELAIDRVPPSSLSPVPEALAGRLTYQPRGLAADDRGRELRILQVHRDRSNWRETPVEVAKHSWPYLQHRLGGDLKLLRATRLDPIEYHWEIGVSARLSRGRREEAGDAIWGR